VWPNRTWAFSLVLVGWPAKARPTASRASQSLTVQAGSPECGEPCARQKIREVIWDIAMQDTHGQHHKQHARQVTKDDQPEYEFTAAKIAPAWQLPRINSEIA
jgi:hypothetical protein